MSVIINKYVGITHPVINEGLNEEEYDTILEAWKYSNCSQGVHLWDEVWSNERHYLVCDACDMEVDIEKITIPDGKDIIIDNSNGRNIKKK